MGRTAILSFLSSAFSGSEASSQLQCMHKADKGIGDIRGQPLQGHMPSLALFLCLLSSYNPQYWVFSVSKGRALPWILSVLEQSKYSGSCTFSMRKGAIYLHYLQTLKSFALVSTPPPVPQVVKIQPNKCRDSCLLFHVPYLITCNFYLEIFFSNISPLLFYFYLLFI